jgi:hypothetical protein
LQCELQVLKEEVDLEEFNLPICWGFEDILALAGNGVDDMWLLDFAA